MAQAGAAVFDNLALIFAIGIAIGLSVDGSGAAGLAGAIGYLVMKNSIDALSKGYSTAELQDKLGKVQDLIGNSANVDPSKLADTMTQVSKAAELSTKVDMKVLGGIIVGVIAGLLYNKFHKIKLPEWLGSLLKTFRSDCYIGSNANTRNFICTNLANNSKWH